MQKLTVDIVQIEQIEKGVKNTISQLWYNTGGKIVNSSGARTAQVAVNQLFCHDTFKNCTCDVLSALVFHATVSVSPARYVNNQMVIEDKS